MHHVFALCNTLFSRTRHVSTTEDVTYLGQVKDFKDMLQTGHMVAKAKEGRRRQFMNTLSRPWQQASFR